MPTDKLRAQYGSGNAAADRQLEQLYFQYGRYLLIASSRAGSLPANLQGVWNDKATPPWNADYHVNINLQMNYWPAEVANLAETAPPLFDFVDHLVPPGKLAAQRYFGAGGWTMFLNTNAWGYVGPIDWPTAFWQPEASAWLAQHFYEHYLFSQDAEFLKKRAWPVMKGAAEFWLDALVDRSARRQTRREPELLARARAVHRRRRDVAADRRGPVRQHRRGRATGGRQGVRGARR